MNDVAASSGRTVAVTGATGFIGARLLELMAPSGLRPRILSHRGAGGGATTVAVDVRDAASLRAALEGCQALVHCAFDFADLNVNLEIAGAVTRACAAAGVRLVQVSTAAVYEPFPDSDLDETVQVDGYGSAYKQIKLGIEDLVLEAVRSTGLDAVILQPTVVYGPRGGAWTDSPVRELLTGTVVLPDRGEGLCNAVFVDDVCRAILAAAVASLPSGERFLVSGEQPVTWKDFYGAYGAMLGLDALELQPPERGAGETTPDSATRAGPSGTDRVKQSAKRLFGARAVSLGNLAASYATGLVVPRRHVATGPKSALFRSRCRVRIDKARAALGFVPVFDLDRGMAATQSYVTGSYGRLARLKRRR